MTQSGAGQREISLCLYLRLVNIYNSLPASVISSNTVASIHFKTG